MSEGVTFYFSDMDVGFGKKYLKLNVFGKLEK